MYSSFESVSLYRTTYAALLTTGPQMCDMLQLVAALLGPSTYWRPERLGHTADKLKHVGHFGDKEKQVTGKPITCRNP